MPRADDRSPGVDGITISAPSDAKALRTDVQIAGAVVEQRDHSRPFVLGSIFASRRSFAQATRSARANALKQRFDLVVVRTSVQHLQVDVGARAHGKALEEVVHQLGLQIADEPHRDFRRRPPCAGGR